MCKVKVGGKMGKVTKTITIDQSVYRFIENYSVEKDLKFSEAANDLLKMAIGADLPKLDDKTADELEKRRNLLKAELDEINILTKKKDEQRREELELQRKKIEKELRNPFITVEERERLRKHYADKGLI